MNTTDAFSILKLQYQNPIGIDLEFISDNKETGSYYPKPCIMQISSGTKAIIVDLINTNSEEIQACKTLLSDKTITKIFHDCTFDIYILHNVLSMTIYNIFDTQLVWRILNNNFTISYKNIIKENFGIDLPKEQQLSDWTKRPLTRAQIEYCLNDVKFLPKLYEIMKKIVNDRKKIQQVKQDTKLAVEQSMSKHSFNGWIKKLLTSTPPYSKKLIKRYKDLHHINHLARAKNLNPFSLLKTKKLIPPQKTIYEKEQKLYFDGLLAIIVKLYFASTTNITKDPRLKQLAKQTTNSVIISKRWLQTYLIIVDAIVAKDPALKVPLEVTRRWFPEATQIYIAVANSISTTETPGE